MESNKNAVRLVEGFVNEVASGVDAKYAPLFLGKFAEAPTKADYAGQLYLNTATATAGLYIATGTTTPGWTKIVISE